MQLVSKERENSVPGGVELGHFQSRPAGSIYFFMLWEVHEHMVWFFSIEDSWKIGATVSFYKGARIFS